MIRHAEMQPNFGGQLSPIKCSEKTFPVGLRICFIPSLMHVGLVSTKVTLHMHPCCSAPSPLFSKPALESPTYPHSPGGRGVAELWTQPQGPCLWLPSGLREKALS